MNRKSEGSARPSLRRFGKQDLAFEHADRLLAAATTPLDQLHVPRVFAEEFVPKNAGEAVDGCRGFCVTTLEDLWAQYRRLPPAIHDELYREQFSPSDLATHQRELKFRHFYEIIREGVPCHLYLDLEFSVAANPLRDPSGSKLVFKMLSLLQEHFASVFGLEFTRHDVVELDSSTDEKFSRHVIVRVPGHAFQDNAQAGLFMASFYELVVEREPQPAAGDQQDSGPSGIVHSPEGEGSDGGSEEGFKLSQMSDHDSRYVDENESFFVHKEPCKHSETTCDGLCTPRSTCVIDFSVYSRNRSFRIWKSSKLNRTASLEKAATCGFKTDLDMLTPGSSKEYFLKSLASYVEDDSVLLVVPNSHLPKQLKPWLRRAYDSSSSRPVTSTGKSPYPEVEDFVIALARFRSGAKDENIFIRSYSTFGDSSTVMYSISGNRWCGNIGRQHRSNGVFYVVNLGRGLVWQKCFDPECSGYRSESFEIPNFFAPIEPAPGPAPQTNDTNIPDTFPFPDDDFDEAFFAALDDLEAQRTQTAAADEMPVTPVRPGPKTKGPIIEWPPMSPAFEEALSKMDF